jgi:hypothetical protein
MSKRVSIITTARKGLFVEFVHSIEESLDEICEHRTYFTEKEFFECPKSDVNIIIHGRQIKKPFPKDSYNILIQTEQDGRSTLDGYDRIFDFFPNKIGTYLPIGYSKYFDGFQEVKEDIPFYFFGALSARRRKISRKFGINTTQVYGKKRDDLINRAKFNVNILYHEKWMYTPLRSILVLSKGKILLQEETKGYGYHDPFLIKFNEDNFLDVVSKWRSKKKRREFGMYVKETMKPFKEIFLEKVGDVIND